MVSAIKVYDPMNVYHQAMKKIESSGIRPTKQRRILARILFDNGKYSWQIVERWLQKIFLFIFQRGYWYRYACVLG